MADESSNLQKIDLDELFEEAYGRKPTEEEKARGSNPLDEDEEVEAAEEHEWSDDEDADHENEDEGQANSNDADEQREDIERPQNGHATSIDQDIEDVETELRDEAYDSEDNTEAETRSHFSDSSSDEEDWAANALQEFRARTESLMSPTTPQSPENPGATDLVRVEEPVAETDDTESQNEESGVADTRTNEEAWPHCSFQDEALLPVKGVRGDDIYRQDALFLRKHQFRKPSPLHVKGQPSLLGDDGLLQRKLTELRGAKENSFNLEYRLEEAKVACDEQRSSLSEKDQEIGMLKHAVDTRDANVRRLTTLAEQWQTAFERQRPLADAERERQQMIEAGVEMCESAETQTSPIEEQTAEEAPTSEEVPLQSAGTQTDAEVVDQSERIEIVQEIKELSSDNEKLTNQVLRQRTLLEEIKVWIEARDWVEKKSVDEEGTFAEHEAPRATAPEHTSRHFFSPKQTDGRIVVGLPLLTAGTDSAWPDHWTAREQAIRRSQSWVRARAEYAAQLDAWEKHVWLGAQAGAVEVSG